MVVAAALVVIAAEKQETKTEGKTFAQFPLTKRAAEVNLFMTTHTIQTLLGKPTLDTKRQWTYSEEDGDQKTDVTIRFAGNGSLMLWRR